MLFKRYADVDHWAFTSRGEGVFWTVPQVTRTAMSEIVNRCIMTIENENL